MLIQFLGTNAGSPTLNRNVSSIALILNEYNNNVWLFDCGESTQRQILYTSIKLNKINKIFITHLHGDHIFGLPGLLTTRSMFFTKNPLTLYGPKGVRNYILNTLKISNSFISFPLNIVEINKEGEIYRDDNFKIIAVLLKHSIECYGFYIKEFNKTGHLNVCELIKRKIFPGPIYKLLKMGKKIIINNILVDGKDFLGPYIKGKKIVILGDTSYLNNFKYKNIDLLIHESTLDSSMTRKANFRGHSTNIQAAYFAKQNNVKKLIITHFSSRYSNKKINFFLQECRCIFPNTKKADDFLVFKI